MTKKEMELKIEELQKIIIEKDKEIEKLKGKNPRNAGRKPILGCPNFVY